MARVAQVLTAISTSGSQAPRTVDVVERTGLSRPTVHRLLTSLQELGYVDRDEADGRWHLGPELYIMGRVAARRYAMSYAARRLVAELAEATGESAFLSVRRGDELVCLLREEGSFPSRSLVLQEGVRVPLGVSAGGVALLAYQTDDYIDRYLERADLASALGPQFSAASIRERVHETRESGYSINPGLIVQGNYGMAAAVVSSTEPANWVLTITGVEPRFSPDRQRELGTTLLKFAHRLSKATRGTRAGSVKVP
ncbi:IclR family transcriptional regulator [Streptomyces sp. NPDC004539]|uniref:IclR family transcriptional regulator n=1 Tax=Streptomyces sp. NPDC004539 TaxID=3154280 RepID=UPI0033AD9247